MLRSQAEENSFATNLDFTIIKHRQSVLPPRAITLKIYNKMNQRRIGERS